MDNEDLHLGVVTENLWFFCSSNVVSPSQSQYLWGAADRMMDVNAEALCSENTDYRQ